MSAHRTALASLLVTLGLVPVACVSGDDIQSDDANATENVLEAAPLGVPVLIARGQIAFSGVDTLTLTMAHGPEESPTIVQRKVEKVGSDPGHPGNNTPIDLGAAWRVEVPTDGGDVEQLELMKNPKQKFGFDSEGGDVWTCQQAQRFATGKVTITDPNQRCRVEINSMANQDISVAIIGLDDQGQGLTWFDCDSEAAPAHAGGAPRLIAEGPAQVPVTDANGQTSFQQLYNVTVDPAMADVMSNMMTDLVTEEVHDLERNDCLKNALGSVFSDLQAHFYCAIPLKERECYVPEARQNGSVEAFKKCFAAAADGDPATTNSTAELVAERYGAAFQYVMFNKSGAFNIDSENAVINAAYQQQGMERPRRFNDTWPEALDDQPRYVAAELQQIRAAGSLEDPMYLEINNDEVNPGEGYVCTPTAQNPDGEFKTISFPPDTPDMLFSGGELVQAPQDYFADSIVGVEVDGYDIPLPMTPPQLLALAKTPYEYLKMRRQLVDGGQLSWDHPRGLGEFPARTLLAALRRLKRYYWTTPYSAGGQQVTADGAIALSSVGTNPGRNTPVDGSINFYSSNPFGVTSETWSDIQGVFFSSVPNYRHSCLTSGFRESEVKTFGEITEVLLDPNNPSTLVPVMVQTAEPRDTCGDASLNNVVHKYCSGQYESAAEANDCGSFNGDHENDSDLFTNPTVGLSDFLSAYNLLWVDPQTMTFVPVPEHIRRNLPAEPAADEGLTCPERAEESSIDDAMQSPAAKWARQQREAGMFNVWGYVIESQAYAFDFEMQQAIINAVFNDDKRFAEGDSYAGPFNPCDPQQCNTWRGYKRGNEGGSIDPNDGTHCRTDKTIQKPLVSLGPWGR